MNHIKPIILVTDDARVNRMILKKYLEKLGCEVIEAVNGLEAVKILQKQTVSLIFMDIEMPEMDGLTASQTIRQQKLSKAPIIALTGHDAKPSKDALEKNGITQLISKPISAREIDKIQRRFLDL
ncbi:MAG: response regulator [Enterobacterales bacterium]|nr:response regulator [Enterobacterales bacterium]